MFVPPRRWVAPCLSLVAMAALGFSALAQDKSSDLLRKAKQMQEIATQQADSEVRAAIRKADSSRKADALDILQNTLKRIESNDEIQADRKASMIRTLKDRIKITETAARIAGESTSMPRSGRPSGLQADLAKNAESQAIKEAFSQINILDGQGRTEEAERKAVELLRRYPDHPAVRALRGNGTLKLRLRDGRDQLDKQDRNSMEMMKDLQKKATPIVGDVEFDKKRWQEIDKMRKRDQLTKKERELLEALNSPVQADWNGTRFEDVINFLATVSKQTIVLDKKALEAESVTYETPVKFVAPKPIAMRTALRKVLQDLGLTYIVKDELIYVTSAAEARKMMTTRVYPIGDLITATVDPWGNPLKVGPWKAGETELEAAKMIVDMIKNSIDPMSWVGDGGQGTITYSPLGKVIVIRQSAEIHMMLKGSLGGGK